MLKVMLKVVLKVVLDASQGNVKGLLARAPRLMGPC